MCKAGVLGRPIKLCDLVVVLFFRTEAQRAQSLVRDFCSELNYGVKIHIVYSFFDTDFGDLRD